MIITIDTVGVTVKRHVNAADHVRLGVFKIALWKNGNGRPRDIGKPALEHTLLELRGLLEEMENLP